MKNEIQHWYDLFGRKGTRRDFMRVGRDAAALVALGALPAPAGERQFKFRSEPFTLGVASGDPMGGSVVLWTRLDAAVLAEADAAEERVAVEWEISADEDFRRIVKKGSSLALKELGHSVHAEVTGLPAGRPYWYRFNAGGQVSATGRTRTFDPALQDHFRFAFVSCQNYEHGYFTAYRHLAGEDLDLVVHLGDYIYERRFPSSPAIREHESGDVVTLEQYRGRYNLYKKDPNLQAAHAAFPWIVTPDDHEVANNYANAISENPDVSPEQFLLRRAAGYQAYYEYMPLWRSGMPKGPNMQLYRRLKFGRLLDFFVLDTRQYRSDQPCGDGRKPQCAEALAPAQTMMGADQEKWLVKGLGGSASSWNVLANQVMMAPVMQKNQSGVETFSMDQWSGYVVARNRLLSTLATQKRGNVVVITGDIHSNWVADLRPNFDKPASPAVATEFVGTSISAGGDGNDTTGETAIALNPHIKFFNARRGYVRATVTPSLWTTDYRIVPYVTRPNAPIQTRASFVVENGKAGAQRA